jgi:SAM-dependent methyltransferase
VLGTADPHAAVQDVLDRIARAIAGGRFREDAWHRANFVAHAARYAHDLDLVKQVAAPGSRVLEVGSAPGHFTAALRLAGYDVAGVDLAPDRVQDLFAQFDLVVAACDIERDRLPFSDAAFACVVCAETFEHLRWDPFFALSEMNRVLQPGGTLLLSTPNLYSIQNIARFLTGRSIADPLQEYGKLRSVGHMGHVREYSAAQMRRILAAHGFSVTHLTCDHFHFPPTRRGQIVRAVFALTPRRFRTFLSIVATKSGAGPRLAPLGQAR